MPSRNIIKPYLAGGYYHIYNRGVNKRTIFKDEQDYSVFLSYLKTYLLPMDTDILKAIIANPHTLPKDKNLAQRQLQLNNFNNRIELLAYILMTNHFHFLIHQTDERDVKVFMQSLMTRYTMYFNRRYKRVGTLFQGHYKAVLIETDELLLYITRYIHRNSTDDFSHKRLDLFRQPSSYPNYLGELKQDWIKPEFILQNFDRSGFNSYQSFVESEDNDLEQKSVTILHKLELDAD